MRIDPHSSRSRRYTATVFSLLIIASAVACFPTLPTLLDVDASSPDSATSGRAGPAWGACAWRTHGLPVPTVSSVYENAVLTITVAVADIDMEQAEAILVYYYGSDLPASIEEIPLNGSNAASVELGVGPDADIRFDARAIRRNDLNLVICSYDAGPYDREMAGSPDVGEHRFAIHVSTGVRQARRTSLTPG